MEKFSKGTYDDYESKYKRVPEDVLLALLTIFNHSKVSLHREEILETLIWEDPSRAKYFARSRVPFDVMFDLRKLDKIMPEMDLKQKRLLLSKSTVDVGYFRMITLNKMTLCKRYLRKRGYSISSNSESGMQKTTDTDLLSTARSLYFILRWNCGQIENWHELVNKFSKECQDSKLVALLKTHSNAAMHEKRLPKLTEQMKEISQVE